VKTLTALFGAAAGVAAIISVGAGVATAAPDVVGQTYRDAKNTIRGMGAAVIIATRTGALAERDQCIVTQAWDKPSVTQRWSPRPPADARGTARAVAVNGGTQINFPTSTFQASFRHFGGRAQ
jgi:hypothetical protein